MTIYFDENISQFLAKGFNTLQTAENRKLKQAINVKSIKEEFGAGCKDEDWIPKAGNTEACILTQDMNIRKIRDQNNLCKAYNLGMFYIKPPLKTGLLYWDMVSLLVKHWKEISAIVVNEKRPFAYKITPRGGLEKLEM